MTDDTDQLPPILAQKRYASASVFTPESLMREARRQKGVQLGAVPRVCLLDPDGDILRHLTAEGRAWRRDDWACYHTELFVCLEAGVEIGLVGSAVGASFAVLVAEE
ncbi:hypothetical protein AB9K34_15330 [Sedimentitalea sp. XS_ASV28]|uniref:hypothetical protein n=1 Tax=Sedimentitalea sp. XS_ASV28 TaxID=3241296 RepID=UPI0035126C54